MIFKYSSDTLAELLKKTRAKCDLTRIDITSMENRRENTYRTQFVIKPPKKLSKYYIPNPNYSRKHMQTATQSYPNQTKMLNSQDIHQKTTPESHKHYKNTRNMWEGRRTYRQTERQTDGQTDPGI